MTSDMSWQLIKMEQRLQSKSQFSVLSLHPLPTVSDQNFTLEFSYFNWALPVNVGH